MSSDGYIDLKYSPHRDDLIARYYVEPRYGVSFEDAASSIAEEATAGNQSYMRSSTKGTVFYMDPHSGYVDIAFPKGIFEVNNMPQIYSVVAGNIFALASISNLRLLDIKFPPKMIKAFEGPVQGIEGIRKILKIKTRLICGTVCQPYIGMKPVDQAKLAYETTVGGVDLFSDDEKLTSLSTSSFEKRYLAVSKALDKAEKKTGEKKGYIVNITGSVDVMNDRMDFVKKHGGKFVMVNVLATGFGAFQYLRKRNDRKKLVIHGHRVSHALFTKDPKNGISMPCLNKLFRLIGVDQTNIGSVTITGSGPELHSSKNNLIRSQTEPAGFLLGQNWLKIKPTLPVLSRGITPSHILFISEHLGNDVLVLSGKSILSHPEGPLKGAKELRSAIDVTGRDSKSKHKNFKSELKESIERWTGVSY